MTRWVSDLSEVLTIVYMCDYKCIFAVKFAILNLLFKNSLCIYHFSDLLITLINSKYTISRSDQIEVIFDLLLANPKKIRFNLIFISALISLGVKKIKAEI